jgi:hypothetical protein
MTQQIIDLEISSPGAAPGAANMNPPESIGFSRGRQSLDNSVWYNGTLMTFLASGEDTHGQFAKRSVGKAMFRPRISITGKMRSSTYWRARSLFRSAIAQSRACPAP